MGVPCDGPEHRNSALQGWPKLKRWLVGGFVHQDIGSAMACAIFLLHPCTPKDHPERPVLQKAGFWLLSLYHPIAEVWGQPALFRAGCM